MGQEIVLLSLFTFSLYLVVRLILGTKCIQVSFITASLLPLDYLRHPWKKKKKAVKKENLFPLEINLANLKSDREGLIKSIKVNRTSQYISQM